MALRRSLQRWTFAKVNSHVHDVIASIAPNDSVERFTGLGVTVIEEAGSFKDRRTVVAGDHEISARRFVVATGSSAAVPPIEGLEDVPYLTNETIFENQKLPRHLIVIGGGPIGMELAQAHCRLGSKVTVLELFEPLAKDDPETDSDRARFRRVGWRRYPRRREGEPDCQGAPRRSRGD